MSTDGNPTGHNRQGRHWAPRTTIPGPPGAPSSSSRRACVCPPMARGWCGVPMGQASRGARQPNTWWRSRRGAWSCANPFQGCQRSRPWRRQELPPTLPAPSALALGVGQANAVTAGALPAFASPATRNRRAGSPGGWRSLQRPAHGAHVYDAPWSTRSSGLWTSTRERSEEMGAPRRRPLQLTYRHNQTPKAPPLAIGAAVGLAAATPVAAQRTTWHLYGKPTGPGGEVSTSWVMLCASCRCCCVWYWWFVSGLCCVDCVRLAQVVAVCLLRPAVWRPDPRARGLRLLGPGAWFRSAPGAWAGSASWAALPSLPPFGPLVAARVLDVEKPRATCAGHGETHSASVRATSSSGCVVWWFLLVAVRRCSRSCHATG